MNPWADILTPAELLERITLTARLDVRFAGDQHGFYSTRTADQLRALTTQAWYANDAEGYQLARSYLAAQEG